MDYENVFTSERLSRYRKNDSEDRETALARYAWNIALSEAIYPTLSLLEVSLRNRIDEAFRTHINPNWLEPNCIFWKRHPGHEFNKLIKTNKSLTENFTRGHLIAELTLGFWVGLFKNEYKPDVWNKDKVFDMVFPAFPYEAANRVSFVIPRLKTARVIRNRISHHEAIFDMPKGLDKTIFSIQETLGWVSVEAASMLDGLDRFHKVYKDSWHLFKTQ